MPLDVAVAPKTLTSTLHYLQRGSEKPAYYRIDPPPGVPRWNATDDPHDVTIEDARGREAEFTLDRNGFALVKAPTAVADFYSPKRSRTSTTRKSSVCCATDWAPAASSSSTTMCATRRGRV
jgi:hypothetical protein